MFILKVEDMTSFCSNISSLSLCGFLFCSDDKNLCSKALLSGVKAFSKADLVKEVEGTRSTILKYIHAQPAVPPPAEPVEKGQPLCHSFCFISSVILNSLVTKA